MLRFFVGSFALALAASAFAEIDVVHDRFDGTTTISTHPKGSTEGLSLNLLGIPSRGQKKQPAIFIRLDGGFEGWRYLDCYYVKWLVDGRPFSLPDATHEGSVGQYGVHEHISITPVTMAQIERLTRAKKVEWKVCNDEYTATEEELQDLRTFLIKMRDPSSVLSVPKAIEPNDTGGSLGKSSFPNSMTIEEKLQELDRRYRNALLLPEEYQRQRAELLEQQRNPPSSIPAVPTNE